MHYLAAMGGGLLIGAAALLLYGSVGRIAGISGIAYRTVLPGAGPATRLRDATFVLGLLAGAALLAFAAPVRVPVPSTSPALLAIGGLLVGFGTWRANGCTSGHGICGLARGSPRSLVSVFVFMATAAAVATLLRPWLA